MKGHEDLIQMRIQGMKPQVVFINDYPCHTDWYKNREHCTIQVDQTDAPETLDLRFLVGMVVSVSADDKSRAQRLFEACKKAHAKQIIACQAIRVTTNRWEPGYVAHWIKE